MARKKDGNSADQNKKDSNDLKGERSSVKNVEEGNNGQQGEVGSLLKTRRIIVACKEK